MKELVLKAIKAMEQAYTPYSHFQVGAALLTEEGRIYTGCNIENAAYTPTNCAERTAFFKDGVLTTYTPPCGVCRQVMMEFCNPKTFRIFLAKSTEEIREMTLEELLPQGFGPMDLKEGDDK